MRLLATGGRTYTDLSAVRRRLAQLAPDEWIVIHGGATGADAMIELACRDLGLRTWVFPARWSAYGPGAGPIRNAEMLAVGRPDAWVAFPGGRGTADMVRRCAFGGVPALAEVLFEGCDGAPR